MEVELSGSVLVPRGRGRRRIGEPPALDRARLTRVLVDLVRQEGLSALNMRRVAAEARVSPRLLYLHVRSKAEMIDLACDAITAEAAPKTFDGPWRARLAKMACAMRDGLGRYPGLAAWVLSQATRPNPPPEVLRMTGELRRALADAGLAGERAEAAYLSYTAYTMGHLAMTEGARAMGTADDLDRLFELGLEQLLDGLAGARPA